MRELGDRNQDLETRLNKSLIDRSMAYERSVAQERIKEAINNNE
jgi:hypothetical protein